MQIDYAHINKNAVGSVFHTRQIFCDVFMTVHKALVAHSLDIFHLKTIPTVLAANENSAVLDLGVENSLTASEVGKSCLIAIDIMNSYGQPFEISLGRTGEGVFFLASIS